MKNFIALCLLVSGVLNAQDSPQQMSNLLKRSFTDQERLNVVQRMVRAPSPDYAEVFEQTLRDLVSRRIEEGTPRDRDVKQNLALLLVQQLGQLKVKTAESVLFQLTREIREPILRGEAYFSLGRVGETDSLKYLAETLLSLSDSTRRSRDEEIFAYGIVKGLEASGRPEAFAALFVASRSWFSSRSQVKVVAEQAWKKLGSNLTETVANFAVSGEALRYRIQAVRYLRENEGDTAIQAKKAIEILKHGLSFQPVNFEDTRLIELYTREAAKLAVQYSQAEADIVVPFSRLIELNRDWSETASLIDAIARGKTDEGITYLTTLLQQYNQRQAAGGNNDTAYRMVNQLLSSFEAILDPRTKQALMEFTAMNYAPVLKLKAQAILDKLP